MDRSMTETYQTLISRLKEVFGERLKAIVLFGSRARGAVREDRDHDIFLVVEGLSDKYLKRQREVQSAIRDVAMRINTISKTPEEVASNLTPLMLEVCVDGITLFGDDYFEPIRTRALKVLKDSGLKRKKVGREWHWEFEKMPRGEWDFTWEGFREL
jgi:uncharacterized protein